LWLFIIYAWPFSVLTPKQVFGLVCKISTDLDNILHTPIVIRNTNVGRLRLDRDRLMGGFKPNQNDCHFCNVTRHSPM